MRETKGNWPAFERKTNQIERIMTDHRLESASSRSQRFGALRWREHTVNWFITDRESCCLRSSGLLFVAAGRWDGPRRHHDDAGGRPFEAGAVVGEAPAGLLQETDTEASATATLARPRAEESVLYACLYKCFCVYVCIYVCVCVCTCIYKVHVWWWPAGLGSGGRLRANR
jgi:hypothetical protein